MGCPEYEELMLASLDEPLEPGRAAELSHHLATCWACAELATVHAEVDAVLARHFAASVEPVNIRESVLTRVARERSLEPPSYLPEVLDFVGYAGVAAAGVAAVFAFAPLPVVLYQATAWSAATIAAGGGLWVIWRRAYS